MKNATLRALAFIMLPFAQATMLTSQPVDQPAHPPATGRLIGSVRNSDTGQALEGAAVSINTTSLQTLSGEMGGFVVRDIPAGDYVVMAAYMGLDTVYKSVTIQPGIDTRLDIEMASEIYKLAPFIVTGEREGNAASIVRQKTSANIKSVVAMDAYGHLPNENAGELLVLLPGIAGAINEDGDVSAVIVRGIGPTLNTTSVNGNLQSSSSGMTRESRIGASSGSLFSELEIIKANTPDMAADSLGGAVNLKTRSALTMKQKRRIEYRLGARWAAPFYDYTPMRAQHNIHALANLQYQEVFDLFGGSRNFGVAASGFYTHNVNGTHWTIQDYADTTAEPAFIWDYRARNTHGDRQNTTFSLNLDYILSRTTKIFIRGFYNDAFELGQKNYIMRAYLRGDSDGNPYEPASVKYYDDNITEIQYVAGSATTDQNRFQLQSILWTFLNRERQFQAGVEHTFDRLAVDYDFNYNRNHANLGNGAPGQAKGGQFTAEMANIGWIVDKTESEEYPAFQQTTGASIYNPDNYNMVTLTTRNNKRNTDIYNGSINVKYVLPVAVPYIIKVGYRYRRHKVEEVNDTHRWRYRYNASVPFPIAPDNSVVVEGAENLPFYDTTAIRAHQEGNMDPTAVGKWYQSTNDINYGMQQKFGGTRHVIEEVNAGYVMGQIRLGQLGILGGARYEHTSDKSEGWVDPDGNYDYEEHGKFKNKGKYDNWFPSIHLTYRITPNILARVSWSNTIGRPDFTNYVPSLLVDNVNQTVRTNNPSLLPQHSENCDVSLEYYFEPVGQLSVGAFYKTITDFIVTSDIGTIGSGPDNGYSGDYEGYTLYTQYNGGRARVRGIELSWQQQFTSLPGPLKGLGALANFTVLSTSGDYGSDTSENTVTDLVQFVPRTANAGITYRYKGFSARVMANYTSSYLDTYASKETRLRYRDERLVFNFMFGYTLRPQVRLYIDILNAFNEPQRWYRYKENRLAQAMHNGTTINFGISGRF